MSREPIEVIGDILSAEMGLASGQIMLTNQVYELPETVGIYIALSYVVSKTISSNNYAVNYGAGMNEIQEVLMHHLIQIDVMSFDSSARTRKEEVLRALGSVASQQAQEANVLQIARISGDFTDISDLEDSARINRYTTQIAVTALHSVTKVLASFYDTFPTTTEVVNG